MATKPTLTDPLIPNRAGDALQKFGKLRLKPSLAIDVVAEGGTFLWVRATWTTVMAEGSLLVRLDGRSDVTAQLAIDADEMSASGSIDAGGVGIHQVTAEGEFLAALAPLRTVRLTATGSAYLPA